MSTVFEQPKHLNVVIRRRLVRAVWPVVLIYCVILSVIILIGLWRKAAAGEPIAIWRWIGAAAIGLLMVGLVYLEVLFESSRRRYVEFRGDKLFLTQRGAIAVRRFVAWSLLPDPTEPQYTRLQLIYRFGLVRQRWSMLLDDKAQISELRHVLTSQIPHRDAI
jgi:hypothetical protein